MEELIEGEDYYLDGPWLVFTRRYHLRRKECCGSRCRHCPYEPRWTVGAREVAGEDPEGGPQSNGGPLGGVSAQ
jgi:hypothetical protein